MSDVLLVERSGGVATLTLNRPDAMNSLSRELGDAILSNLRACQDDDEVRVVVIRGAGRAFCAGDDIKQGAMGNAPGVREPVRMARELPYYNIVKLIRSMPKPVITRVSGFALGAGCDIAISADFTIAAENAQFGLVFVKRGILGGTYMITKLVGLKKASELLLTGEMISGAEAARLGIATRAVPEADLDAEVDRWVQRFADAPTRVIGYIKQGINRGLTADIERGFEYQAQFSYYTSQTEDNQEGRTAFREKRDPKYIGR